MTEKEKTAVRKTVQQVFDDLVHNVPLLRAGDAWTHVLAAKKTLIEKLTTEVKK